MRAFTDMPKLQFAQVSLREVTDEAASLVRDANLQRGVAVGIEVRVSEELTAEVDRGRLVQAFTNLICNATEAYEGLSDRAPVVVDGVQEGGRLSLTVTDAGCGMSAEKLNDAPLLFSTSKRHGTGFGLPLAIKIVESEHLGQLKITSAEGKGTCIEVWLLREQGD